MDHVYRDQVLEVEPAGIEFIGAAQRHGSPRQLFGLWFSANAEIATWMVGVFAVSLYGTNLRSAAAGLAIGTIVGFGLLGFLATFGPRYGVPQMIASRFAFGRAANALPAALSFLAGVGWFAINTVFGAYALQTIAHAPYTIALAVMLAAQIVLAVYGYNLIHVFETACALLLAAGFALLGFVTFTHADWHSAFNAHAPLASGGEAGGFVMATALGFSYATGWMPCASDYSRYLPERSDKRAIFWYAFLGCAVPCIALEIMGAATISAVRGTLSPDASPTDAIAALVGNSAVATPVLLAIVLGTLTANCMNLYSGALAALAIGFRRIARWRAAIVVGVLGALLAFGGGHPEATARWYTNFLLLLSYWASPWAAVVIVQFLQRNENAQTLEGLPAVRPGVYAWVAGVAASIPFWNQAWYTGPFASSFPQLGDLSYYVSFAVAAIVMGVQTRARRLARS